MSVKFYGIYTAYPPTVDLRAEGLGRHLAAFLKAAVERHDVRFVVACPSWSKKSLLDLCESEGVNIKGFDIICPPGKPVILRIFEAYSAYMARKRRSSFISWLKSLVNSKLAHHRLWLEDKIVNARNIIEFLPLIFYVILLATISSPFITALIACSYAKRAILALSNRVGISQYAVETKVKLVELLRSPKDSGIAVRLYSLMEKRESEWLVKTINKLPNVLAWYSPTAFWPAFNGIKFPRLMCVPDVVVTDFPIGFARSGGGDRLLQNFEKIEDAIRGCDEFVTYSEHVKWTTVIDRYGFNPNSVHVVHHAPNFLGHLISVSGFPDNEAASTNYCRALFRGALLKSSNFSYISGFENNSVKFIFYASQFRPNKNVITLLKAYEYLLRRRFIGHKLILTGNVHTPEIGHFINVHRLENDVLCLHALTTTELAACYHLADLAVNPSLSEGGCPFTFTEALSVGTPVVMSRIPVALEIINDRIVSTAMFFDPYDWNDMASRIEWGLENREHLLGIQRLVYDRLTQRSWGNVVAEHIEILEGLSVRASALGMNNVT